MKNIKPNLFIVGTPKSGTTSLYHYLKQHPEIFMSDPKEIGYFCKDLTKEADNFYGKAGHTPYKTLEQYLTLFKNSENYKIVGEASTSHMFSKVAAKEIKKFNPNAKIIIGLREPAEFLYSLHAEYVYACREPELNFEKALNLEKKRIEGIGLKKRMIVPSKLIYSNRVKYFEEVKRFHDTFPKNQIKVFIFDDLKKNPYKVYEEILDFLDVKDKNFKPNFEITNVNKSIRNHFIARITKNIKINYYLRKILPMKIMSPIGIWINQKNSKYGKKKPINYKLKRNLQIKYKPEVEKINEFLNKEGYINEDLVKKWGYDKI